MWRSGASEAIGRLLPASVSTIRSFASSGPVTGHLLENTLAPLTFNWGFIEAPLDAVRGAYVRWQKRILHSVKVNGVHGWTFKTLGLAQDFEHVERYGNGRIADRFTADMLEDYCRALGINLFDETFYGDAGCITHSYPWFLPKLPTVTLAEAREQLGLSEE